MAETEQGARPTRSATVRSVTVSTAHAVCLEVLDINSPEDRPLPEVDMDGAVARGRCHCGRPQAERVQG